ncbi:MAG: hypothetical protein QXI16_00780 [Sulfolobaceae archaeon]
MLNGEAREILTAARDRGYQYKEIASIVGGGVEWGAIYMAIKRNTVRKNVIEAVEKSGIRMNNLDDYFPPKKKVIQLPLKTVHHILNTYYLYSRKKSLDELIEKYMDSEIDQTEFERTDWRLKERILAHTYSDVSMIVPAWYNLLDALIYKSEKYGHKTTRMPKQNVERIDKPTSHMRLFRKFITKGA